ncbi:MAG TPA: sigma 54-interacting transcriptional regulator [Vicinamibacterales bacterium]|jgi:transcriptional regulator with PAS, ATPase and Fis domain
MSTRELAAHSIEDVLRLREQGLFAECLSVIDKVRSDVAGTLKYQAIRAELLERVGRGDEAVAIAHRILAAKNATDVDKSLCEFILARVRIDSGLVEQAIVNLNRSIVLAKRAVDLERLCAAQLKLLVVLSDGIGSDAVAPLLADLRVNAAKSGNPRILAAIHVYFAQIEALRGSTTSARRHIALARQLLTASPSVWLESVIENICLAISIMSSEFDTALEHARRGLELVRQTGAATEYAVNQGNSGFVWHALGNLDEAIGCYERTLGLVAKGSEAFYGTIDSLARIRLAQGRLDDCAALLSLGDSTVQRSERSSYVFRHQLMTRARLALRKNELSDAASVLNRALSLAEASHDKSLLASSLLGKLELNSRRSNTHSIGGLVDRIYPLLRDRSPDHYAKFEEALSAAAAAAGNIEVSDDHFWRASRVYEGVHYLQGLTELRESRDNSSPCAPVETISGVGAALHSLIAILMNGRHIEFVARELVVLLASTNAFEKICAICKSSTGASEVLVEQSFPKPATILERKCIAIGESNGKSIEIVVEFVDKVETRALVNIATELVSRTKELQSAREDGRERASIWPTEPNSPSIDGVILTGQMRDVISYAQRIARSPINVLIIGESGTGKEIVAHAVHNFSERSRKPFIPLNCAAIPRDLLESHLFGYRRGAFTGADRDQLGVVRHAAGGTLFLDEIGEMSLDLQPKLLRFLESGEIAPLGEPSTTRIDVRVIAATNSNLEEAVREGRFREDLFYRLNVVPLKINPLRERRDEIPALVTHFVAQAAREFKKGYLEVAEETMERLILYRWPGNVRQLQNEIRRMVALAEPNSTLEQDAISPEILGALPRLPHAPVNGNQISVPLDDNLNAALGRVEFEMVKAALRANHGRLEPAAKALGISRKGLYLKRQRLGL